MEKLCEGHFEEFVGLVETFCKDHEIGWDYGRAEELDSIKIRMHDNGGHSLSMLLPADDVVYYPYPHLIVNRIKEEWRSVCDGTFKTRY